MPSSADWDNLVWTGTMFVAVAATGECATSPDGITWTAKTSVNLFSTELVWNGVCLLLYSGSQLAISHDYGSSWTNTGLARLPNSGTFGRFVATGRE